MTKVPPNVQRFFGEPGSHNETQHLLPRGFTSDNRREAERVMLSQRSPPLSLTRPTPFYISSCMLRRKRQYSNQEM
ncbi:hypothetical protein ILYODFUR_008659 [Ilyodon furcidens]|uniref:Uncharacterized protein n=1 Tax=Ilyodon furcidens TaxID=33524 RepID=A0ABV0SKB1_9TELE